MDRLFLAQKLLGSKYDFVNNSLEKQLPPLYVGDSASLEKLLYCITNREMICYTRTKKQVKTFSDLKARLADVLLLLDGFDIKDKSSNKEVDEELDAVI
jgi:hypothetical protein